jgi:hypothetical protein
MLCVKMLSIEIIPALRSAYIRNFLPEMKRLHFHVCKAAQTALPDVKKMKNQLFGAQ